MLVLSRSHLDYSELVQCASWIHSTCGIATRLLAEDGTSCPPLRITMTWPFQNSCPYPASSSLLCVKQPRAKASGHSHLWLGALRFGTFDADLEDPQRAFRTLWRMHRSWFGSHVSEVVLSVETSIWLHNVRNFPF